MTNTESNRNLFAAVTTSETHSKTKQRIEFGDFQTPLKLAREVCRAVASLGFQPKTIVEPTCGTGNFLAAAEQSFCGVEKFFGFDVSREYVAAVRARFGDGKIGVEQADFFVSDWMRIFDCCASPMLVLGNPPWVTNAGLGLLDGANLPVKTNFQKFAGLDALTGKSNFDVSEWILIRLFETLKNRAAVLAMLCKTAVARKLFLYAIENRIGFAAFSMRRIDAAAHFGVAADACLLICDFRESENQADECRVYNDLSTHAPVETLAVRGGQLIASLEKYQRWRHLQTATPINKWRSGIKHDCAKVMELVAAGDGRFENGLGEIIELEPDFVFPLLKSSDLAHGREPRKFVIVPQQTVGADTGKIAEIAPKIWAYLLARGDLLDQRKSSIYKKRARFAIFGVGDYSFSTWKVAVSGLYKNLRFRVVGNRQEKPIMLDDTCYFLPCTSEAEARRAAEMLNSTMSREFFEAFIFWDSKRPITSEILNRLNIACAENSERC